MIKTTITCGVSSNEIREKLQQDDNLSLEEAINKCNAIVEAKVQASTMHNGDTAPFQEVQAITKRSFHANQEGRIFSNKASRSRPCTRSDNGKGYDRSLSRSSRYQQRSIGIKFIINCRNCGKDHPINQCSAYGKLCDSCKKVNNFASVCRGQINTNCFSSRWS